MPVIHFIRQPLQVKCLEEGVRRNYQPSQMARRKKKNIEGIKKEVSEKMNGLRFVAIKLMDEFNEDLQASFYYLT